MATLYFTNNADSGAGSLRQTISDAVAGDTIAPDPSIAGDLITISLSSTIGVGKNLTFDGGPNRVRIDGQGTIRLVSLGNVEVTFNDFDFVRGYNNSTGGCLYTATSPAVVFNRCLFAGNKHGTIYYGDIATNSSSTKYAAITLNDCVMCGGSGTALQESRTNTLSINRCTIAGYSHCASAYANKAVDSIVCYEDGNTSRKPSSIGFVNAPPNNFTFDADAWRDWDLRLAYDSLYTTGGTSEPSGSDFYGHTRKANGALGAIEGTWLVVDGFLVLDDFLQVDYLELKDDAHLGLNTPGLALKVERGAVFENCILSGADSFVVAPAGTNVDGIQNFDVEVVQYTANITAVEASRKTISWSAEDLDVPVVIQRLLEGEWETLANVSGGSYSVAGTLALNEQIRLYDGMKFATANAIDALTFHPWTVYSNTISITTASETKYCSVAQTANAFDVNTGFILMSEYFNRGETPLLFARIQDSLNQSLIDPDSVESISYTAYRVGSSWGTSTRTPVEGHVNAAVPLDALLDELVTDDPRWTKDDGGYNFLFEPDSRITPLFTNSGDYVVVVTFYFYEANSLPIEFHIAIS